MTSALRSSSSLKTHLYGGVGLSLLILLCLLPGLLGHDPWRNNDVRHFGAVFDLLQGGWWLLPTMAAGDPITEFGPLYYWVSALFAYAFGWLLPLHDATRLATALFTGMAIFWIARTASRLYGKHTRTPAALLTLGTLGLVIHAHEHQPLIALMTMQAITLAGLSLMPQQPLKGSLQAALGTVLAFMTAGLEGIVLTLPLFLVIAGCRECRLPRVSGALILGMTLIVVFCTVWLVAVYHYDEELFWLWWNSNWGQLGERTLTFADLPRLLEVLGWFVWPLWPIALWTLWRGRRQCYSLQWLLPIVAATLAMAWIVAQGQTNQANMIPFVVPLALLAAAGVPTLRRGAANAFDWFAIMTFFVFAVLVWLAWTAQVFAWPPGLARSLERVAPDFVPQSANMQVVLGAAICVVWIALMWFLPRTPNRGPANWAMGMTMLWCLAVTLLLPWFDHDRSYRTMSESLGAELADTPPDCIAETGLNDSQRVSLYYFAGLDTRPILSKELPQCRFLLVRSSEVPPVLLPEKRHWRVIWEYRQGGDRRLEIFQLYQRL